MVLPSCGLFTHSLLVFVVFLSSFLAHILGYTRTYNNFPHWHANYCVLYGRRGVLQRGSRVPDSWTGQPTTAHARNRLICGFAPLPSHGPWRYGHSSKAFLCGQNLRDGRLYWSVADARNYTFLKTAVKQRRGLEADAPFYFLFIFVFAFPSVAREIQQERDETRLESGSWTTVYLGVCQRHVLEKKLVNLCIVVHLTQKQMHDNYHLYHFSMKIKPTDFHSSKGMIWSTQRAHGAWSYKLLCDFFKYLDVCKYVSVISCFVKGQIVYPGRPYIEYSYFV